MEEDYVWLFERVKRFEMAGPVFASVIFHAVMFFVLASTSYHYPATGNVTKLDILWLYPSPAPMESPVNHPPLADLPGESTAAKEKVAPAKVARDNFKPPTPTAGGAISEPHALEETNSLDLIAARVADTNKASPPVRLDMPKETAITPSGPKSEREKTDQVTSPSAKPKVATPVKRQEAKLEQAALPSGQPVAVMAKNHGLADLLATQERLAIEEADRQHRSAVKKHKQQQEINQAAVEKDTRDRQAAVIARQKVEQEQSAADKTSEDLATFREEQEKAAQKRQAVERLRQEQLAISQAKSLALNVDQPRNPSSPPVTKARQSAGLFDEQQRKANDTIRALQKTVEPKPVAASQAPSATRLTPATAQIAPPELPPEAARQAPKASAPLPIAKTSVVVTRKAAEAKSNPREEATSKPSKKPPEDSGMVIAALHGDLKLVIVGDTSIKLFVTFREFPKARRNRVLTRSEARREQQVVPVLAQVRHETREAVIETTREGIYVFSVESEQLEPAKATFNLKIFEAGTGAKAVKIGARTVSGRAVLTRILMPDGISWDDETAFTGSMEDSNSTTRFNAQTGLNWKEYHD